LRIFPPVASWRLSVISNFKLSILLLKKVFDFFLFSSFFISGCAVLMTHQANELLNLDYNINPYLYFVFFSTICSYNFHWFLTPLTISENIRIRWTKRHKRFQLLLIIVGLTGAAGLTLYFIEHWFWLGIAVLLTFLYSAPKLPHPATGLLQRIAIGKTIFLSFVWTYVTAVLPVIMGDNGWQADAILFCINRFFLVYAICIIFDYRDREQDRRDGIRSLITYLSERGIDRLFYASLFVFAGTAIGLYYSGMQAITVVYILVPGIIVAALYRYSKKHSSDYLYYFVLDGLMMLSAIFTSFLSF
jgi:4-hydroxybenzoate polyprenyltransferase